MHKVMNPHKSTHESRNTVYTVNFFCASNELDVVFVNESLNIGFIWKTNQINKNTWMTDWLDCLGWNKWTERLNRLNGLTKMTGLHQLGWLDYNDWLEKLDWMILVTKLADWCDIKWLTCG